MHFMVLKNTFILKNNNKKSLNSVHDVYLYYDSLLNEKRKSDMLLNELNMLCMIQFLDYMRMLF